MSPSVAEGGAPWRHQLSASRDVLQAAFAAGELPRRLLSRQAALADHIIRGIWSQVRAPPRCALVAVGGYGRGALFPHSDVDLLVLLPLPMADLAGETAIERFIGMLWDAGLEVAHSVRTIEECENEMKGDVTIRTSLLEHRRLAGSRSLYDRFRRRFAATIDLHGFYDAKLLEQQQRHLRHQDTAYNLEPNVKDSPGSGLTPQMPFMELCNSPNTPLAPKRRMATLITVAAIPDPGWLEVRMLSMSCAFACITSRAAAKTVWCSTCSRRWLAKWASATPPTVAHRNSSCSATTARQSRYVSST